jgi:hypothetical protein
MTLSLINPQFQEKVIEAQIDFANLYIDANNTPLAQPTFVNAESLLLEITPIIKIQEYTTQAFEYLRTNSPNYSQMVDFDWFYCFFIAYQNQT